jgi:type II secretory pathway component PulF
MVLAGLTLVLVFLGTYVLPQFEEIFADFKIELPLVTRMLLGFSRVAPVLGVLLVVSVVGGPLVWALFRWRGWDGAALDAIARGVPLVGPVVRRNLVARWCDALRLGVAAGMDLPAAIEVAGDATGSPALRRDGRALSDRLAAGLPLDGAGPGRMLPPSVPATLHFAAGHQDLPTTIEALGEMYQRQAELRLSVVPAVLTPLLVLLIAALIGFVILGLMAPLIGLLEGMT